MPKLRPYIWATAITLPTATAIFRITAGEHYPTDTIVAFFIGSSIGLLIPRWHKKRHSSLTILPSTNQVALHYQF